MTTYYIRPPIPPCSGGTTKAFLHAVVGVPLLSWFVFSALLSGWSLSTSSKPGQAVWYITSTVLILGAAVIVLWALLVRPISGAGPASSSVHGGKGSPPPTPPLAGAMRPVPIRPSPRLVRSAAEPLPTGHEKSG